MPALQLLIGKTRLPFGFGFGVESEERGEGVRGLVKGCARPVDVAGDDAGSWKGRVVEKARAKVNCGRRADARRRQRVHIIVV